MACAWRALVLGCNGVLGLYMPPMVCEQKTGVRRSAEEPWQLPAFQWNMGSETLVVPLTSVFVPLHVGGDIWKDLYGSLLSSCEGLGHRG